MLISCTRVNNVFCFFAAELRCEYFAVMSFKLANCPSKEIIGMQHPEKAVIFCVKHPYSAQTKISAYTQMFIGRFSIRALTMLAFWVGSFIIIDSTAKGLTSALPLSRKTPINMQCYIHVH